MGTLAGQWGLGYLIKRYNRQSIIVLMIAVVVGISAVLMGVVGVVSVVRGVQRGESQGFHSVCGSQPGEER